MIQLRSVVLVAFTSVAPLAVATAALAQPAEDETVTAAWETNCALRRDYSGKLIFSVTQTTSADGKTTVSWVAASRVDFLAVFSRLQLDDDAPLKKRRDAIVQRATAAPGGRRIELSPALMKMVDSFWKDVEAEAERHEVSCTAKK